MYLKLLVLIWLVNASFVSTLWWRLVLLFFIGLALAARIIWRSESNNHESVPIMQNPFEIRPAMAFGALFVILSVVTAFVKQSLGDPGVLGLSAIVGVSDIVPFILSLIHSSDTMSQVVVSAIIMSTMSNTIAKGVYFGALSPSTRKETAITYSAWALLHVPLLFIHA